MSVRCRTVVARLTDHEEGRLTRLARSGIRAHLALCRDCGLYLRQLRAVRAALGELDPEPVTSRTRELLLAKFRAWHAALPRTRS